MKTDQLQHIVQAEIKKYITERTATDHDFGCLMIRVPIKNWDTLQSAIKKEHVYTTEEGYGFETEPHITILFGFHDNVTPSDIKDAVYHWIKKPIQFTLSKVGVFETPTYDVLKFDIDSPDLAKLNELFSKFPHTQIHPEYHPHSTICYLNKGVAERYVREVRSPIHLSSNSFIFSTSSGKKYEWVNDKRLDNDSYRFTKTGPISL